MSFDVRENRLRNDHHLLRELVNRSEFIHIVTTEGDPPEKYLIRFKGVEIGTGFANARLPGSQVHDEMFLADDGQTIKRHTNNSGGFEGGITTGEPVIVRAAMKPISTVLNPRRSVNLATGEEDMTVYERSDFCAVPRAAVVGEAMMAIVLAEALMDKLGGDSIGEMEPRFAALNRARLDDLAMDNVPWQFGYG